jgi:hypothetical protein
MIPATLPDPSRTLRSALNPAQSHDDHRSLGYDLPGLTQPLGCDLLQRRPGGFDELAPPDTHATGPCTTPTSWSPKTTPTDSPKLATARE